MKLKRFTQGSDRGFSLIELLVAVGLGLVISAIALTTFLSNRRLVRFDLERTAVNQNLKNAIDVIGINIRLAGENLSSAFPAIEIIDGGANSDELIIRRNLKDEILKLCTALNSGTNGDLFFGIPGTVPGCVFSDQATNFASWSAYRQEVGGIALGYIYNPVAQEGEFFWWQNEIDDGANVYLELDTGEAWSNNYPVGQTAAYIIEEWRFALSGNTLTLEIDGDSANPQNVVPNVQSFFVQANMQDGSTETDFDLNDDWTQIETISVSISSSESVVGSEIQRTYQANFFPRNVLSN